MDLGVLEGQTSGGLFSNSIFDPSVTGGTDHPPICPTTPSSPLPPTAVHLTVHSPYLATKEGDYFMSFRSLRSLNRMTNTWTTMSPFDDYHPTNLNIMFGQVGQIK